MTEDLIEWYDNFKFKGCLEDLIFGGFNNQPIPFTYSDLTNNFDDGGTTIEIALVENKVVEDKVMPNDKNNDDNSLASYIEPPPSN